ncbi:MAG: Holliday junction resolvase RuvX [Verrucomicrobiales bacterium]|nr:Holliday junction resolvase RuvX [Verrucomicrobiales bacterium]
MAEEWVKALGIDYGTVRIGLATSDDIGMLAHPFQTISGKSEDNPAQVIHQIVKERGIKDIVIGLPLHSDGSESTMSKEVAKFVVKLRKELGENFPIHEVDELRTTRTAREKLQQAGKKEKEVKGILDQVAAAEILQDWLDQRAGSLLPDIDLFPEED